MISDETLNTDTFNKFLGICIDVVPQHIPCKTKLLRANQCSFINKELTIAIMARTTLRDNFSKSWTTKSLENNWKNLRKSYGKFYRNINEKDAKGNKNFGRQSSLFLDNTMTESKRTLIDKNFITKEEKVGLRLRLVKIKNHRVWKFIGNFGWWPRSNSKIIGKYRFCGLINYSLPPKQHKDAPWKQ